MNEIENRKKSQSGFKRCQGPIPWMWHRHTTPTNQAITVMPKAVSHPERQTKQISMIIHSAFHPN